MLKVGFARKEITPTLPITLSGFISRCNEAETTVKDPLYVRCLALEYDGLDVVILSYDLLGLGEGLSGLIQGDLDATSGRHIPREQRLLCCTHTHAAPATIELLGCGVFEDSFWSQVRRATVEAVGAALAAKTPAHCRTTHVRLDGFAYDRTRFDSRSPVERGRLEFQMADGSAPASMFLLAFTDEAERPVAGIAHWAAHPVLSADGGVSADYPGRLCQELERRFHAPFMFLQGAAGNINPPIVSGSDDQLASYVSEIMTRVERSSWSPPRSDVSMAFTHGVEHLAYSPRYTKPQLRDLHAQLARVAATGTASEQVAADISMILNIEATGDTALGIMRHTCRALATWAENWIIAEAPDACAIPLRALRIGTTCWCFVAAEMYYSTQAELQRAFPDQVVNIVGYSSPLRGYIPVRGDADEAGYELDYAYRFYNHPAPFADDANDQVLARMKQLVEVLLA